MRVSVCNESDCLLSERLLCERVSGVEASAANSCGCACGGVVAVCVCGVIVWLSRDEAERECETCTLYCDVEA